MCGEERHRAVHAPPCTPHAYHNAQALTMHPHAHAPWTHGVRPPTASCRVEQPAGCVQEGGKEVQHHQGVGRQVGAPRTPRPHAATCAWYQKVCTLH